MVSNNHEGLIYLQFERQVTSNAREFISKIERLAHTAFGEEPVASLAETTVTEWDISAEGLAIGGLETTTSPINRPRVKVYSEEDLALVLARKSVPNQNANRYNPSNTASRMNAVLKSKHGRDRYPKLSVASRGPVRFDRIQDFPDPLWGTEIVLLPQIGTKPARELSDEVREAGDMIGNLTTRTAYPSSPMPPHIPIMRLRDDVTADQVHEFVERAMDKSVLPEMFTLGKPYARSGQRQLTYSQS